MHMHEENLYMIDSLVQTSGLLPSFFLIIQHSTVYRRLGKHFYLRILFFGNTVLLMCTCTMAFLSVEFFCLD